MRFLRSVALVLLACLLFGCPAEDQGKVYGKRFIAPKNIASLSPGTTEILARWGPFSFLKGRTSSCNWPSFINNVPVVLSSTSPDYESLVAKKFDLVVYDPHLFSEAEIQKIKELGIPTYEWDPKTVAQMIEDLYKLGAATGSETKTSQYADKIYNAEQLAKAQMPDPAPTVALILPSSGSEHMIAGKNSFQADELKASGGDVVGPDADRFVPLDAEALLGWDPQVLIVAGDAEVLLKDPRLQSLAAVKSGRVYPINPDAALRRGGRVDQFILAVSGLLRTK
ncbi:MAG: ABC transporter substrate-binding protein [Fimbriimonadaceae bacterium]|nr:ABC transporter substrate-binding protein [Chthonomonadaceae bacterium]MCO5296017.1 ABC transporter substrate-binding protein [Fimbriimonadaceae bacterium]